MRHYEDCDDRFNDRSDYSERPARAHRYNCGGFASHNGPCGAYDCASCYPGGDPRDGEEEGQEEESTKRSKTVTARKPRFQGTVREIKVGDRVRVTSWFTYQENGPRTGYQRTYTRIEKGAAWLN